MALLGFLAKKEDKASSQTSSVSSSKGWYADRYQALIIQRNLFFILAALCIIAISLGVIVVGGVIDKKRIEPMVVEVDELSGITTLVNPEANKKWAVSKVINQYFLTTYVRSRETYNIASYLYNYNTIVRLFSASSVYSQFKEIINDPSKSPISKYGANNTTTLEIRSILFLKDNPGGGQTAQIRFTIVEEQGGKARINKIASILWDYVAMTLNFDDMMVNPLGFQVQFYTVSDDVNA